MSYIMFQAYHIKQGTRDSFHTDIINHGFEDKNITIRASNNPATFFEPMMEFSMHNRYDVYDDLSDLKEVFEIDHEVKKLGL